MKKLKDIEHKTREHNKNIQYFFCTKWTVTIPKLALLAKDKKFLFQYEVHTEKQL